MGLYCCFAHKKPLNNKDNEMDLNKLSSAKDSAAKIIWKHYKIYLKRKQKRNIHYPNYYIFQKFRLTLVPGSQKALVN